MRVLACRSEHLDFGDQHLAGTVGALDVMPTTKEQGMSNELTNDGQVALTAEEAALLRLCEASVSNGIAIADGTAPDFSATTPEAVNAVRRYIRTLTGGVAIPPQIAEEPDARCILLAEVVACTNAAVAQRLRDRAWQRADGSPP